MVMLWPTKLLTHQTCFFPSDFDSLRTFWTKKNSTTQQKHTDGIQKKSIKKSTKKIQQHNEKIRMGYKKKHWEKNKKNQTIEKKSMDIIYQKQMVLLTFFMIHLSLSLFFIRWSPQYASNDSTAETNITHNSRLWCCDQQSCWRTRHFFFLVTLYPCEIFG